MKRFAFSIAMALTLAVAAIAQSNTGNLVVSVSDQSGVIPGASIVMTDNQTGRERTLVTGADGSVSIPQLEVGAYTVKISAANRKTKIYNDVKINIGQTYALNASLEAGNITETVEVSAGAELINSSTGEISRTISSREIQDLPLNGRNPLALIALQAGTSSNGATNTTINGQRTSFTNITRDGLNIQDNFIRSNATDFVPDRPNTDDVGEFTITNQNAGVESGYGASQVQLVTPRGSNDFHGSAYIYNRNSKFTANSFFNNANKVVKPFLNRNQFGGKFSGPILKNKVFFFGAYESFRLRQASSQSRTVLTPAAKSGVFTYLDATGATQTLNILNATYQQVIGSPITAIDSIIAARVLSKLPAGNSANCGDTRNTTCYLFNQKSNQDREALTLRFDGDVTAKHSLSTVYSWRTENNMRPDIDNGGYNDVPFGFQGGPAYTTNSAWRWTPTSRLTNEVRVAMQLTRPKFGRNNEPTDVFLSLPLVSSTESTFQKQGRNTAIWTVQDNGVLTLGDHTVRFGATANWYRVAPFGPPAFSGSTIPTVGVGVATSTTGLNFAAFPVAVPAAQQSTATALLGLLGGIVSSASQSFYALDRNGFTLGAFPQRRLHYENYGVYVGDQWRASQNITVNYGIRWEYFTPISEPSGLALEVAQGPNPSVRAAIMNSTGVYNFVGSNLGDNRFFNPDKNNFAPNISFAWSPNFEKSKILRGLFPGGGKTVIRGGFSVSYVNDEFVRSADNALSGNQGLTQGVSASGLNQRLSTFTSPIAVPAFSVPRTFAQNNALAANFGTVYAIDPDIQVPGVRQWNIGIQRELGWKTAFEIRYVGNRSNNLVRGLDFNEVNITTNGWLDDFLRARANMAASGGSTGNPVCTTTGCVPLTILNNTTLFGPNAVALLANSTIKNAIWLGNPADLAITYINNPTLYSASGTSNFFLPNPGTGVVDYITNSAISKYNSLQLEVRRRFSDGLYFQANYTLQKTLTDAPGTGQTRFEPLIKNAMRQNEYARAGFDTEHVFNANAIYELPIGKGKRFFNQGGIVDNIFGGWQLSPIVRISSGAPIIITDPRGTLNRAGRSGAQTANSSLTNQEISNMISIYRTPCGVYWLPTTVINISQTALNAGNCAALGTGRGAEGFGTTAFAGQAFFNVGPGFTGNMSRYTWNGPNYINIDASMSKRFRIKEDVQVIVKAEGFNVTNRANFFTSGGNIGSTTFGRVTSTFSARVMQGVIRLEF